MSSQVVYVPKEQRNQQNSQKKSSQQSKKGKAASVEFPPDCKEVEYMDSHTHLFKIYDDLKYNSFETLYKQHELDQFCKYGGCINVNCWAEGWSKGMELQKECRNNNNQNKIYSTYGLHPNQSFQWNSNLERDLRKCLEESDTVAVGECGLDYNRMSTPKEKQHEVFKAHLNLALEYKKPVVVHSREAEEDTFAILSEILPQDWLIHIHCFTGTSNFIQQVHNHFPNAYFGFTGVVTFPNGQQQYSELLKTVRLDRLIIETDGPYMAPVPHRGKPAHPGYIPYTALHMSKLLGISLKELLTQTVKNTKTVYRLKQE